MLSTFKTIGYAIADLYKGHDMRPYADRIVERTLRRLEDARAAGEPLVLLIGENHGAAAHQVIQILVLKKLKESGRKIAVGLELPHNSLLRGYYSSLGRYREQNEKIAALEKHAASCDPDGAFTLKCNLGTAHFFAANMSKKSLLKFLHDKKISTGFNDAAITNPINEDEDVEPILDLSDDLTQRAAVNTGYKANEKIDAVSSSGMHIRNALIVERALDHAQRSHAEIYVQNCGTLHVAGTKANKAITHPYEHSLSALFRRVATPVLNVPLLSADFSAGDMSKNHGLAPDEMILNIKPPGPILYYPEWDLMATEHEWKHLNRLLRESGLDPKIYQCNTHDQLDAGDQAMKKYFEWDRKFLLPPANDSGADTQPRRAPG